MSNPLLKPKRPIPFDSIRAEHVEPAIEELLKQARRALRAIAESEAKTYQQTFGALDRATEPLEISMGIVEHLESVATNESLRAAYNEVLPEVSEFWSSIALDAELFAALTKYAESSEGKELSGTKRRFVDKTLDDFRRQGAGLDEEGKKQLQAIDRELSQLTTRFSQNVLDSTNAFELIVDEARVQGLPPSARTAARESAAKKGAEGYRLTLQAPSVIAVLTYADDRSLREEIWRAFNQRGLGHANQRQTGEGNNLPLVARILELRKQRAQLLGFADFADLVTADRMAHSGREAIDFVRNLREKTEEAFKQEQESLLAFRRKLEGPEAPELAPWDVAYYAEKQRKAEFDFDEEALRPYFSAPKVLQGAFLLAERLYGVKIEDVDGPVWHEGVLCHRIVDEAGTELGLFYTDLYPRENKRDGAWMHGLIAGVPPEPHVALFCANAQPPSADAPSLMSFRDVETVFHEFGHLLHHCLSRVDVRSLACTHVAQDFVELPSQIMENWCAEKEALDGFAHHYQSGEPLPDHLVERLVAARNFRAASSQMRQLGFAAVDLALHVEYDPERHGDVNDFANGILAQYAPTALPDNYALIASFSHLFAHPVGYAAGYYSYKWAEVLDADAFSRFKQEGLFNPDTGKAFRNAILSRGDSAEPLDLFKEFMGRPPKVEPMLERQGLGAGE